MNYQYNLDKATYVGRTMLDRNEYYRHKRENKKQNFMKPENEVDFKNFLRDPELYVEIKTKLKNA